ncbi:uncharacterized protein EI90DRAFT_3086261 [Cantharellus anzutake]|uniref:uncharacterized protein n=1 Tax=Cantharellus anzutake TaxID=1750568 RepID=UPI0019030CAB|nr:uncharacterized protein EI90DRAFT_3086261 [Cantharellus anzutake]KAF8316462.1 hypothetical protein EI90DRAFT_3086261 [Cantharellus anzutake]
MGDPRKHHGWFGPTLTLHLRGSRLPTCLHITSGERTRVEEVDHEGRNRFGWRSRHVEGGGENHSGMQVYEDLVFYKNARGFAKRVAVFNEQSASCLRFGDRC